MHPRDDHFKPLYTMDPSTDLYTGMLENIRSSEKLADMSRIKKVIFNPPATIVYWIDGSKTVVKAQKNEKFDKMTGEDTKDTSCKYD